jgi:hypothetical protein
MEAAKPDVYRAICQVAKELSKAGIAKDKTNTQGSGYKFRGIDDVYNALSAVMAGADLCVIPRMVERTSEERQSNAGKPLFYVTVRAEFDFVSARDGSKHTAATYGEAMDSGDKATNKAMSAAFKYACFQTFVIPTEGMDDADAHTPDPAPKPAPKPWHAQFKAMYKLLGEKSYLSILGTNGYTSAIEVPDQKTAQAILAEMAKSAPKKEGN